MNDPLTLPAYTAEELAELSPARLTNIIIEDEDRTPRNVIDECAARGDAMTEYLQQLHEDDFIWQLDDDLDDDGVWWLRLHAVMILGLIPSERAGLLLVELMRRMALEGDDDLQGWISGYWPALFRNKPESVIPALRALGEDRSQDWFERADAFESVVEAASRQGGEALEQALAWLANIAGDESEDWECRQNAARMLLDFPRPQYRPLLEDLEARQDDQDAYFDRKEIEQAYAGEIHPPQWERFGNPWKFYEPEAIAERQQRWSEEAADEDLRAFHDDDDYPDWSYQEPYIRPEPKVGRNDPCPCGSGKKYKQCCLKAEQAQPQDELLWHRIRRAIEGSPMQMLEFGSSHFGREALLEAWDDFMPPAVDGQDEEFATDTPHMPVFMPWFFYEWLPDPRDTSVNRAALDGRTLGRSYLDKKGRHLDPLLVRYIEQCCTNPFSFYDVQSVRPGDGFALRDIFIGEEIYVTEHSGSRQTRAGDILFGKVVKIDGVSMLESCAPVMFPPMEKSGILKLRKKMEGGNKTLTPDVLREYLYDMLDIYHDIAERLLNPAMPELQNTDGDPLLPHKLYYEIGSPRAAFDALSPLCLIPGKDQLLAEAAYDDAGDLRTAEFSWHKEGNEKHKSWDNTILGHIKIDERSMNIEVNSENRAQKIRALVEEMLPDARYKTTVIESLQAMLARAEEEGETASSRRQQKEIDELNSRPEVQAEIAKYLRQHYSAWPETKLPALNGQTPLQAVKTRDGREMVEALLLDFERRGKHASPPLPEGVIEELRERLGL